MGEKRNVQRPLLYLSLSLEITEDSGLWPVREVGFASFFVFGEEFVLSENMRVRFSLTVRIICRYVYACARVCFSLSLFLCLPLFHYLCTFLFLFLSFNYTWNFIFCRQNLWGETGYAPPWFITFREKQIYLSTWKQYWKFCPRSLLYLFILFIYLGLLERH